MTRRAMCAIACCFLGAALVLGEVALAQQQGARGQQSFPQPTPAKAVTVTAIPGVIAAGAQWKLLWQGPDNADGIVGTSDGGLLFAQEQPSTVGKLDANDKFSIFARDTHGTGALGIDSKGRVIGAERTCSDPGGNPNQCHEPAQLIVISSQPREVLASEYNGKTFWRMGELVCDSKGGVYFSDANGTYFVNAAGQVSLVVDRSVRTNGMMLSRDEKTLYLTNGGTLVAFDVRPDGTTANQREFAKLQGGNGDGMAIDAEGRLYVTAGDAGIQVFSKDGKYLGRIPLPRSASSVAFGGPGKKILYGKGAGMTGPNGEEYRTPAGVRNNAKAIYKINMIAQGFTGRPK
jgi:sugar lactone lactonase YvrE